MEALDTMSKRLSHLMKQQGYSIRALARAVDIHPSKLQSWTCGTLPTDFEAVSKICTHLGCSFKWLLTGEDEVTSGQVQMVDSGRIVFEGFAKVSIKELVPIKVTTPEGEAS